MSRLPSACYHGQDGSGALRTTAGTWSSGRAPRHRTRVDREPGRTGGPSGTGAHRGRGAPGDIALGTPPGDTSLGMGVYGRKGLLVRRGPLPGNSGGGVAWCLSRPFSRFLVRRPKLGFSGEKPAVWFLSLVSRLSGVCV